MPAERPTLPGPSHLEWPFLGDEHRALAAEVARFLAHAPATDAPAHADPHDHATTDAACRRWVRALGDAGLLRHGVPAPFGAHPAISSRALCVLREALAAHDGLADFAFAMQGLGAGPISLGGTPAAREAWLPRVASGDAIAAFALSEPDAGSDAGALACRATRTDGGWRLDGVKTWISNGGIADFYCVFARSDAASTGAKGVSAFLVPATTPGLDASARLATIAPHPLATVRLDGCVVPIDHLLGEEGRGFALAMQVLDIFRTSVAAAAVGFARRALAEALGHAGRRAMFGGTLGTQPLAQAILGDMATDVDTAALLTYRAAWQRDVTGTRTTMVAAMAKLGATELAQQVIDRAVQLHGGQGVASGAVVERLYREIRALRIYEGASEVQRLLIGREALKAAGAEGR